MNDTATTPEQLTPTSPVDIQQMLYAIHEDLRLSSDHVRRMEEADEVMECWWEGQHPSGLKVPTQDAPEPVPFPYASDTRIRLAEEIVNEKVLLQKAAALAGARVFKPVEHRDAADAALMSRLVGYFLNGPMRTELRDEQDYLLNWKEGYGIAAMQVGWIEERALEKKTLTMEQLMTVAVQAGLVAVGLDEQSLPQQPDGTLPEVLADAAAAVEQRVETDTLDMVLAEERRAELVEALIGYDPALTKEEARRLAAQLKENGEGTYHVPYVKKSQPKVEALLPLQDLLIAPNAKDPQKLPRIPRVHYLTAADLRDRAALQKWPEGMLEKVLAKPGRHLQLGDYGQTSWVLSTASVRRQMESGEEVEKDRYELLEVWHRATAEAGAPAIYRTVIHGAITDQPLEHELSPYKHGDYPFLFFRRERKRRSIMESRGIPELVMTNQWSLKAQFDARRNRTDMAVAPPMITSGNRAGGGRIVLAPNMQINEKRAGTLRWVEPPRLDMDSVKLTEDERKLLDIYFGRFSPNVPDALQQLHNQTLVNDWLLDWGSVLNMITQLVQQYVTPERAERILGTRWTVDQTRAAIQAQWDINVSYDVKDFDLEWLEKKAKMWTNYVLASDNKGLVKGGAYTRYMARAIDPVMAEDLVEETEDAERNELLEEDAALAEIFSGGEPDLVPGLNHEARAQRMLEKTQQSQTRIQLLRSNGQIAEVWENRYKFHQTRVMQDKTNKLTGRLGGKPVLGQPPKTGMEQLAA